MANTKHVTNDLDCALQTVNKYLKLGNHKRKPPVVEQVALKWWKCHLLWRFTGLENWKTRTEMYVKCTCCIGSITFSKHCDGRINHCFGKPVSTTKSCWLRWFSHIFENQMWYAEAHFFNVIFYVWHGMAQGNKNSSL